MAQDPFNLRGYIMLEGQQKGRQAGEGFTTFSAVEPPDVAPLLVAGSHEPATAGAMLVDFPTAAEAAI